MGRPPSLQSSFNSGNINTNSNDSAAPPRPWTPPLWLTGEKEKTNAKRVRQFTLPIPPISPETYKAVVSQISKQQQPFMQEKQQLNQLQAKLADQRAKVQAAQARIRAVEQAKEEGLRDIRELRQQETQTALENIEKKLRSKHEKETRERETQWKKDIEEECNANRKRLREQQEEQVKQQQDQEEKEPEEKKQKLDDDNKTESKPLKSDEKKKELAELEKKLDNLNENRTEMIWLLKQVIKAEEKQKAKSSDNKKPEPRITTSKQA